MNLEEHLTKLSDMYNDLLKENADLKRRNAKLRTKSGDTKPTDSNSESFGVEQEVA